MFDSCRCKTVLRFILATLVAGLLLAAGPAGTNAMAQAATDYYVRTGQTGAQTQIDAFHKSTFTITVQSQTEFRGGLFTMKAGSATNDPITFKLYQGSNSSGTLLASASYPNTAAFCAAHGGNCQSYISTPFTFAPVMLQAGTTYYAELTSPAPDAQSRAYFIKGAQGCYVATANGIKAPSSCSFAENPAVSNQPYISVIVPDPEPVAPPDEVNPEPDPLPGTDPDPDPIDEVTYQVTVINDGDTETDGETHVYVDIPEESLFIGENSDEWSCQPVETESVLDCQPNDPLPPGEESTIEIIVEIPDTVPEGAPLETEAFAQRDGDIIPEDQFDDILGNCVANTEIECTENTWEEGDYTSFEDDIAQTVGDDVEAFMASRIDHILASLDQQSRIKAFRGTQCGFSKSASLTGGGSESSLSLNGSGSASMKGGIVPTADAPAPEDCGSTNIWSEIDVRYVDGSDEASSGMVLATVGFEYLVAESVLAGVRASFDFMDASFGESSPAQSDISGSGWFAGPYVSAEIMPGIFLDGFAAYGTSWNDYDGSYEGFDLQGDFDTQRVLGQLSLSGDYEAGAFMLSPLVGVSYAREWSGDFSVDAGELGAIGIDGQEAELGRLSGRLDVTYRVADDLESTLDLIAAPTFSYDFVREDTDTADALLGEGAWRGGIEGGFRYAHGRFGLGVMVGYDGIGAPDWSAYSGELALNYVW